MSMSSQRGAAIGAKRYMLQLKSVSNARA